MVDVIDKSITTSDSVLLKATWYLPISEPRRVVLINSATGALRSLYRSFSMWLAQENVAVLTYDNRGIGESCTPAILRDRELSFVDWGAIDYAAMIAEAKSRFPQVALTVLGHSIGGMILGFTPDAPVERIVTLGAQTSFWRDWRLSSLPLFLFQWGVVMPLTTRVLGYFPGSKLGYPCDLPAGIARQWVQGSFFLPCFTERRGGRPQLTRDGMPWKNLFTRVKTPIYAISMQDDPIGTARAVDRAVQHFSTAPVTRIHWSPAQFGLKQIGHFGFARRKASNQLWPALLDLLAPP
jgi:predicted alpha/beta hydrolase